jgi:hypothetical protein
MGCADEKPSFSKGLPQTAERKTINFQMERFSF